MMYGTIARFRIQEGKEADLRRLFEDDTENTPGFVFAHVYRMDGDPLNLMLAVAFESREAYHANAESTDQQRQYEQYRALLEEEPEWHDGEIIFSQSSDGSATSG
jgi:quinol monooxygenase YgiN